MGHLPATTHHMTNDLNSNAGLRISCEKTKAMSTDNSHIPVISVSRHSLETVDDLQYLGSYVSIKSDTAVDIQARCKIACLPETQSHMVQLFHQWIYTSSVLSSALPACVTRKSTAQICKMMDVFHRRCIQKILGILYERRLIKTRLHCRHLLQTIVYIGKVGFYQRGRQATVRRAIRLGLYTADDPTLSQLAADMDNNLFADTLNNPQHVLHKFLPDKTDHTYSLRPSRHSLSTVKTDCNNFISKLLFKDIY